MAWTLIKLGGDGENYGEGHKEFMLDAAGDIATEPTNAGVIAPGSIAYTADMNNVYQKKSDGTWAEIGA